MQFVNNLTIKKNCNEIIPKIDFTYIANLTPEKFNVLKKSFVNTFSNCFSKPLLLSIFKKTNSY